jgi:hypothetical protein
LHSPYALVTQKNLHKPLENICGVKAAGGEATVLQKGIGLV